MNTMFKPVGAAFKGAPLSSDELPTFYTRDHQHSLDALNGALQRKTGSKLVNPKFQLGDRIIYIRDGQFTLEFKGVM